MKTSVFVFCVAVIIGSPTYAAESSCQGISNYQGIVTCAEGRSPDIQRAESEVKRAKAQTDAAAQFLNPNLDVQSVSGKDDVGRKSETELTLTVPVELGGKRSARKGLAQGELAEAEAKLYAAKATVRSQIYLSLHRLRQLISERKLIDESVTTFQKLVQTYQKRPARSPEQEVTLSVFRISQSDFELRQTRSDASFAQLSNYFKLSTGLSLDEVKRYLPKAPSEWPKVDASVKSAQSPRLRLAAAEVEVAKARLSGAQSESWPTVNVGPAVKMNEEPGQSYNMVGATVSLPLPLFSFNRGNRAAAAASLSGAQLNQELMAREETGQRDQLVASYQKSVQVLGKIISGDDLEKKHFHIEQHFLRGTVPSTLVIEAHRSLVDLEENRNQRQLETLEMLLQIYALDGTLMERPL